MHQVGLVLLFVAFLVGVFGFLGGVFGNSQIQLKFCVKYRKAVTLSAYQDSLVCQSGNDK